MLLTNTVSPVRLAYPYDCRGFVGPKTNVGLSDAERKVHLATTDPNEAIILKAQCTEISFCVGFFHYTALHPNFLTLLH
jgi:hypothetical protein